MGPTRWPVDIYLADHTVEERHATAWDNTGRFEHLKALNCESQGTVSTQKKIMLKITATSAPHRQTIHNVCNRRRLTLVQTHAHILPYNTPSNIIARFGASSNFIDQDFVQKHNTCNPLAKENLHRSRRRKHFPSIPIMNS
jgi:hypothetical protein